MEASTNQILLVDDDESILEYTKYILQDEGYKVETARTGQEGINKLMTGKFDLVLLDVVLPDIRGEVVASKINKLDDSIYIVFFTGYPSFQHTLSQYDIEFSGILIKPVFPQKLINMINEVLDLPLGKFQ